MIKLIASDMDGTLLDSNHKISEENIKAIEDAENKGVIFTIATGRDYNSVKPVLESYNIKCECIVLSGAEYRDSSGNVLESIEIEKKDIKSIIDEMHSNGIACDVVTNEGIYASEEALYKKGIKEREEMLKELMGEEGTKEFLKQFKHFYTPKYIEDIDRFISSDINVYKIMAYSNNEKLISDIKKNLVQHDKLAIASTSFKDIEITHIDAQKGKILKKVIKKMNIAEEEVMVIGDSLNDYSMFEEFECSFAMGNAMEDIKSVAKYITDTNDNYGVAKAIYKVI